MEEVFWLPVGASVFEGLENHFKEPELLSEVETATLFIN